ncbi:dihydrofolate reductase [Henriciella sp. AS95]|uniref:dihydrofolate reductase n=1 Tax=Henriciella sp. AS95 TaxID=3135782 RepID=UPI00316DDCD7
MPADVRLSIIVARAKNGVIGKDGDLPWRLAADLAMFKKVTSGKPIIMGRKTWESLPKKPLPRRSNIVLTRDWSYAAEGARVYSSFNAAVNASRAIAAKEGENEVFVIGGASLYEKAVPIADRLYVTDVDAEIDGDVRFPEFDESEFVEAGRSSHEKDEKNEYSFVFRILERPEAGV